MYDPNLDIVNGAENVTEEITNEATTETIHPVMAGEQIIDTTNTVINEEVSDELEAIDEVLATEVDEDFTV